MTNRRKWRNWKWIFMEDDPPVVWYVPFYNRLPCWKAPQAWRTYVVFPKSFGSMYADAMFKRMKEATHD